VPATYLVQLGDVSQRPSVQRFAQIYTADPVQIFYTQLPQGAQEISSAKLGSEAPGTKVIGEPVKIVF